MKMNRIQAMTLIVICTVLLVLSFLLYTWYLAENNDRYNTNPNLDNKIVGSHSGPFYVIPMSSLNQLVGLSDLVIIGEVATDAVKTKRLAESGTPLDQKFIDKFDKPNTYTTADVKIKVKKVLHGSTDESTIIYAQLGVPNSYSLQTKVHKNDNVVLFLKRDPNDGHYASVSFEEGVFLLDEHNKLLSQSVNKVLAQYDGISLDVLEEDIRTAQKHKFDKNAKRSLVPHSP